MFEATDRLPDLWIGVTFEVFQSEGNLPCLRERLNREVRAGEIEEAVLGSMVLEIPFGHGANAVFNL